MCSYILYMSFVWPHLSATLSYNLNVSSLRFDLGIGVPKAGVMAVLHSTPNLSMAVTNVT